MPTTKPDTDTEKYYVTNLYDVVYLLDQNRIVVLQANRPPSVADMEAIAARFNQLTRLRKAATLCAIPYEALLMDAESKKWIAPKVWTAIENAVTALREALAPTGEQS